MRITLNIPNDQADRVAAAFQKLLILEKPAKSAQIKEFLSNKVNQVVVNIEREERERLAREEETDLEIT